ncbi:MAG: twin-arginine translocase subunit TatC [Syntrophomonadaceae bacterium]|nr:twin-arginine translocase subunit TatC [Syntrophomonadaceae bacterium]
MSSLADMTPEEKMTLLEHLKALRRSLIISVVAILTGAVVCFIYNEPLLAFVIEPLTSQNENLVVTGVTEAFFVKLKLSLLAGFTLTLPITILAIWSFFKPALYPKERKNVYIQLPVKLGLFFGGLTFAYFGILQLILKFFIFIAGESLETMFKVDQYVSFVLAFCIPFGLIFELPVVVFFLSKMGLITKEFLAKNRKYAILIIVMLSAALTPGGDPFSMGLMAVPVYILYEVSIIVAKFAKPSPERAEQARVKREARAAKKAARKAAREARRLRRSGSSANSGGGSGNTGGVSSADSSGSDNGDASADTDADGSDNAVDNGSAGSGDEE